MNLATGDRFEARSGRGRAAQRRPDPPVGVHDRRAEAIVGLSGFPPRWLGWKQFRALGAVALDLCAVASGIFDGYLDCSRDAHGVWDYLAGALICTEAGAMVGDAFDRELLVRDHAARRTPVAGATPALYAELVGARRSY